MNLVDIAFDGSLIQQAHDLVRRAIDSGDTAVDATVGNGHDTLFLAGCVGADGKVVGFDVQAAAISATRERLMAGGVPEHVFSLYAVGHERMAEYVRFGVSAVMFNLGYLPGSDKTKITRSQTTLRALGQAVEVLRPGGVLSVMCYPGHAGGAGESDAVVEWFEQSSLVFDQISRYRRVSAGNKQPFLLVAGKSARSLL